jgi:hypothetical protein
MAALRKRMSLVCHAIVIDDWIGHIDGGVDPEFPLASWAHLDTAVRWRS